MAVHVVRRDHNAQGGHYREKPEGLSRLASLAVSPSRHAGRRALFSTLVGGLLANMAHRTCLRRDPPRRPCRRHLARTQGGHAHRLHEGPRRGLAPRQKRGLAGMGGPHGAHRPSRRGGKRRRQRLREGEARRMAGNARAEVHLPCVRAGEALHDDKAQAPGGSRALRDSQRPPPLGKPRRGSGVAGLLRALVRLVGRLPQGEGGRRRQGPVQARTAEKGAPQPREARARRHAVHLPRCEAAGRRSRSRHEQPDRRRRERRAARDAQAPSGHGPGAAH